MEGTEPREKVGTGGNSVQVPLLSQCEKCRHGVTDRVCRCAGLEPDMSRLLKCDFYPLPLDRWGALKVVEELCVPRADWAPVDERKRRMHKLSSLSGLMLKTYRHPLLSVLLTTWLSTTIEVEDVGCETNSVLSSNQHEHT